MYSRILVPVDGSASSLRGLREAIGLAGAHRATLVVVNIVTQPPLMTGAAGYVSYGEIADVLVRTGQGIVDAAAADAAAASVACETRVVDAGVGQVSDAIVEQAARERCELIVMGTHGRRGLTRLTLGSDAEMVVRQATVPVLLVRATDPVA